MIIGWMVCDTHDAVLVGDDASGFANAKCVNTKTKAALHDRGPTVGVRGKEIAEIEQDPQP